MRPLRKDRRPLRINGRPALQTCTSPCCGPVAGCPWYYKYVPCVITTPAACGYAAGPLGTIYVGATLRCNNGARLCDIPVGQGLPVIKWAGWCWRPDFSGPCTHFTVPGATNLPTLPPGQAYCPLPCNAVGPEGPDVECYQDCTAAPCSSPSYIFPKRCPGQPGVGQEPQVFICGYQIAPSLAAGFRCPSVAIGNACYYWDWTNPSPTLPAGYSQFPGVGQWLDGCCTCVAGQCTTTEAVQCPGIVTDFPLRCCAHRTLGKSYLEWELSQSITAFGNTTVQTWRGSAIRANGVVNGTVTYSQTGNPPDTGTWSNPETGPFSILNFSPGNSGIFGAQTSLVPCGVSPPGSCPPGTTVAFSATSNCVRFQSQSSVSCFDGSATYTTTSRVFYSVVPNAQDCEGGCSLSTTPATPPANEEGQIALPCLIQPSESLPTIGALEILGV